ncbi:CD109 antigen isoform X3 [Athene noctua]|uniref:CD109 antigen isoform X3 n=1 Tax=Athene noctua TaxID=126797 RepID=UPI003EBFE5B5
MARTRRAGCRLLLLLLLCSSAAAGPTFLVAVPWNIRPGANVTVGVTLLPDSPAQVTVRGEVIRDNETILSGEMVFEKDSFGTLVLPVLPLNSASGNYELLVEGHADGQRIFSNRTSLMYMSKSISVFIQTDKSMYKPGQDVMFRIVTVYPDLKPYKASLNIYIRDPRKKLIQQWLMEEGDLGVVSKKFQLSVNPPLGDWSIEVEVNGQVHYQRFKVMEYVLPKFDVMITTPLYYSLREEDVTGVVTAKYTYGKPVKGTVTVTCLSVSYWTNKRNITTTMEINGSVNVTCNKLMLQNLNTDQSWHQGDSDYTEPIEIIAVVTESLTGISQNSSTIIFPKQSDYFIEFMDYSRVIKPSLNFIATLKVTRSDSNQLTAAERQNLVTITAQQSDLLFHHSSLSHLENEATEERNLTVHVLNYTVPENGIIDIEFPIQSDTKTLRVQAEFLSSRTDIGVYDVFSSPSQTYLQVKTKSQDIKAGKPFELSIASNKPVREFHYLVLSKEQIMAFGTKAAKTFTLTAENSWAPLACILVFYVDDLGVVVNDALTIPVQPVLDDKIKISWSKDKVKPSEKVSLKISTTEPGSVIGLAVVDKTTKLLGESSDITEDSLEAFQPFFIFLNLPYSIIRGEQFILEVNIFNYLKEEAEVTVILDMNDAFEIILTSNEINATEDQQSISVPSEDGRTVQFPIKPKQLGEIPIKVTAVSSAASDAIVQKVLVKAEGLEQTYSQTVLLDLTGNKPQAVSKTLDFTFPSDVVSGSERVQVTAVGDLLGPSINGLSSLIKMPYGCGEQNMINFAPNVYVLQYLTKTRQLREDIKSKAVSFMRKGYQRELLFQRDDGSFSAFGNEDPSGSTWLSAFVLRCFLQARPFIDIDQDVLMDTAKWIVRHQKLNGEFHEPGKVLHSDLQGGTNNPVTLTAYIMSSLLGFPDKQHAYVIKSATNFLEDKLEEGISDNYTLALVTYALSWAKSTKAKEALNILNQRAEHQGEFRFWITPASEISDSWQPRSIDIELAAYALLSHFHQDRFTEGIPIMKWLSQQRNHLGGFSSTQDTVVALQALSLFAALTTTSKTEMDVTVTAPSLKTPETFSIDTQNRFLLQTKEIAPAQPMTITVAAEGTGFAVFQLNVIYNTKHSDQMLRSVRKQEAFDLNVDVKDDKDDKNHLTLNVCTRYLGSGTAPSSGMVLMEVGLLSGFSVSPDFIPLDNTVKKMERDNGKVNLYLDSLNETQVCVDIPAVRDFKVANIQDASVTIVDYYEPRRRAVRSYNSEVMQSITPCDFCESDCSLCHRDGSPALLQHSSLASLFCVLFVLHVNLLCSWVL